MPKVYTKAIRKGYNNAMATGYMRVVLTVLLVIGAATGTIISINGGSWSASADHDPVHWEATITITGDSSGADLNSGISTLIFGVHPGASAGFDVGIDQSIPPAPPQPNIVYYFSYPNNDEGQRGLFESIVGPADGVQWPLTFDALVGAIPASTIDIEISGNFSGVGDTPGPSDETDVFVDLVDPVTGAVLEILGSLRDGPVSHTFDVPHFGFFKQGAFMLRVVEAAAETTASISAPATGDEGDSLAFDGSASTPSEGQNISSHTWNFGDGTPTQNGDVVNHTYTDNGTYDVTLTVTDPGGSDTATHQITIGNLPPTVAILGNAVADEGDVIALNPIANFTDPGDLDTHTATIDWGDGSAPEAGTVDQAAGTVSGTHSYEDEGAYTVTVKVTDNDGDFDQGTMTIAVGNVAPQVTAVGPAQVNEATLIALNPIATFVDAGDLDTHTATIDWGDGSAPEPGTVSGEMIAPFLFGSVSGSHTYADDGDYTVVITVQDNALDIGTGSLVVTVNNVAPEITSITVTPDPVDEGQSSTVTIAATDVSNADLPDLLYSWDCDDNDVFEVGPSPSNVGVCTFEDGQDQLVTVNVKVDDQDEGTAAVAVEVFVNNLDPVIASVTANPNLIPQPPGSSEITVAATDVAGDTPLTYRFDCDSDGVFEVAQQGNNSSTCDFTAEDEGPNTVAVLVEDKDGGSAGGEVTIIVGAAVDLQLTASATTPEVGTQFQVTLDVTPNRTPVERVLAGINFGWRINVVSIDNGSCAFQNPSGVEAGTIDCDVAVAEASEDFTLATITFDAGNIGPAFIHFDPLRTNVFSQDTSVLGQLSDDGVRVQGEVDLVMMVQLQALPAAGDNVRFDVGVGHENAEIVYIEAVTGDQVLTTFFVTLNAIRTDIYDIGIVAIRDGGLNDTLWNLRRDVLIDREPGDAEDPLVVDMGLLLEGNAVGEDEIINALDMSLLASTIREGRFDARVDFDRSGGIDVGDLAIVCGPAWDSSDGTPPCSNYLKQSPVLLNPPLP